MNYPAHLQKLIEVFKRLPGVGARSAERFAFHLLDSSPSQLADMGSTISQIPQSIRHCEICGCLCEESCLFCQDSRRSPHIVCVVASAKDAFAIDRTNEFLGLYHVLGGLLSPLEGKGPQALRIDKLIERIEKSEVGEIIIALDATVEGDATSLYIKQLVESFACKVSRLAFGLPMGSSLEYVDGDTLGRAFSGRQLF